jgi:hypothetical protein
MCDRTEKVGADSHLEWDVSLEVTRDENLVMDAFPRETPDLVDS